MSTSGLQLVPNSGPLCSWSLIFGSDGSSCRYFCRIPIAIGFSLKKLFHVFVFLQIS